jgi:N-acyl amino acid synthase of PEP-CTERM/exosortase system
MPNMSDAGTEFAPHFQSREIHWGRDDELMRRVLELRFQVYCEECGFLPSADYPEHTESDLHDATAAHFCALNLNHELVGYVRLVRPGADQIFPFQQHCSQLFEGMVLAPPTACAEISRLMVRQDYRRRHHDALAGVAPDAVALAADRERREPSPQILLSLYREMYRFSLEHGIRYWYAAMERSLARVLTRMNFAFQQLGPQIDYYGPVSPYLADLREMETRLGQSNLPLYTWMSHPK